MMLEWLISIDHELYFLLNGRLHNPFFDTVMTATTTQENWYAVLLGIWVAMIIWGGRKGRLAAVMLVIGIGLSDQISCALLKPLIGRLRPINALPEEQYRLIVGHSKAFSFPSAHAANSFTMATIGAWASPRWLKPILFIAAAFVAYSRIYVGVHYPFDALAGALIGVGSGWLTIWGIRSAWEWWERRRGRAKAGAGEAACD
ncbi:MAG: phosphatase PAP2 family protein [Candidatus Eisenbacteria bacterium]|nr:phosphatase PAP2 family protein [Candidatus Eisenbacteria bacterium]